MPAGGVAILACGNAFRGDDAAGPEIARRLHQRRLAGVTITQPNDALAILGAWEDAALAIVLDAAVSGSPPGTIHRLEVGHRPLPKDLARCSTHGQGLAEALELGRILHRLPARLILYAIEAAQFDPGTPLSPEVAAAIDAVVSRVLGEIAHADGAPPRAAPAGPSSRA